MASWVVAHEGGELHLRPAGDEAPVATPAPAPAPAAAPSRPSTDQIASFLPPAPALAQPAAPARPAPGLRVQLASGAIVLLALAFLWVALRPSASPAPLPAPSAPPATAPAPAAAVQPSAAPASGCVIVQTTATFYAPAGSPAPIAAERGAVCHLVAWHSAYSDWRQITIGSGAPVWVPLATLSEASTATLPNLAPPPTPTAAPPPPATARPVVIVEQAPPAPTQCATVRGGGATVQRCGSAPLADLQADAEAAWREQMQVATAVPTWSDLGTYAEQATDMAIVASLHGTPTATVRR